ncbi:hypothetical protein AYM40_07075 [Paraburkholderia phytofirmans OLGA172]|uniref:Uncharacterized protein n=1 Tax=Paraburkholderia phytofirmans OLGA172 TaxID=1417228 RepID=A0A161I6D7_9BURK|nr:hypothetical protein AYM40_07075 [Paraburkholderia phytofirmans OLGA172]
MQQDVEFDAVRVDCTPKQLRFATQGDEHLVEVPRATRLAARRFHPMGKPAPNFSHQRRIVS